MNLSSPLLIITVIFVTCLITANIIAVKVVSFGFLILPAAIFVFPLSYIVGDVLTEVYGYHWARKVIWLGFGCNLIFVFFAWVGQLLPPAPFWGGGKKLMRVSWVMHRGCLLPLSAATSSVNLPILLSWPR